jgi:hypothetical protein
MAAIDSRFFECAIYDFSRRSDERFAGEILLISRLFSNQHDWRGFRSFAKDSLRGALVRMACCATPRSFTPALKLDVAGGVAGRTYSSSIAGMFPIINRTWRTVFAWVTNGHS